jgi:hypothetical protein
MKISQRRLKVTLYAPGLVALLLSCTVGCGQATQHREAHIPAVQSVPTSASAVAPPHPRADYRFPEDIYPSEGEHPCEEGRSVVRICVKIDGTLSGSPAIDVSSGSASLDKAALQLAAAGSGHYVPGTRDGLPVQSCVNSASPSNVLARNPPDVRPVLRSNAGLQLAHQLERRCASCAPPTESIPFWHGCPC